MKNQTVIQAMVNAATACRNCAAGGNLFWQDRWNQRVGQLSELLPSGSGFDNGTAVESIEPFKVTLRTAFHHMNDNGMYDGWTEHAVIVRPDWSGVSVIVKGRDKNGIKDYIADTIHAVLTAEAPEYPWG